jgi:hypothetical protein
LIKVPPHGKTFFDSSIVTVERNSLSLFLLKPQTRVTASATDYGYECVPKKRSEFEQDIIFDG